MSSKLAFWIGLYGFSALSAIAALVMIDRFFPAPLVLMPALMAAPSIGFGWILIRAHSVAAARIHTKGTRLHNVVFVGPVILRGTGGLTRNKAA